MKEPEISEDSAPGAPMTAFTTATLAVGCLYQVTGSPDVTLAGTAISAVLAGWAMWLHHPATGPGRSRTAQPKPAGRA